MSIQNQNDRNRSNLPIGKKEDVEFSEMLADEDDKRAQERAAAADARAEQL